LAAGGHLTHGHKVNFSGSIYNVVQYGVNKETGLLDFNEIADLAQKHKPKVIVCGASAYSRIIDFTEFRKIADAVGAYLIADIAHIAGLVVTKEHPNPAGIADIITTTTHKTLRGPRAGLIMSSEPFAQQIDRAIIPGLQGGPFMHTIAAKAIAFKEASESSFTTYQKEVIRNAQTMAQAFIDLGYTIVTGGTDNHLFIIDLRNKGINGLIAQNILEKVGITSSRSCIPFDPENPWITSGIRLGTPSLTTRGLKEADMARVAELIDGVITHHDDETYLAGVKKEVSTMMKSYPLPY
jgi:glycine hydroxymethyltransferase